MNVERWSQIDALFDEALSLPPERRAAFLDRACGDDRELREAVERLIAADESAKTFLERPPLIVLEGGEEAAEGSRFGPYRIERLLSRGGMGTVYLATRDDGQFERRVALKLLQPGMGDPDDLQRFRAERQILARLEHPAIARLYDGGETEQGIPFLVMEYVEGLPLDAYCDQNRLEIDDRLRLFRRLLDAVAYAHQNLLVHRDLKPANILVTAEGEPKLLDFGIAKQLTRDRNDESGLTRFRMMTPGYASPEQVRGEAITTASDVYALGVVLYELLCGRSPYRLKRGLPHELEMAILDQEPERPSQALDREDGAPAETIAAARRLRSWDLRRKLRGDLDTIVLMALRKEPQRRYRSVIELASDIDRYLREMPVSARPDKPLYRAGKFVRRHRLSVAVTGLALVLIAGLFLSLIQQRRRLERERDTSRAALAFLVNIFEHADPYQKGAENVSARELLETGARRATRELARDPEVQADLLNAIGQASVGLGQLDEAAPLLERSLAVRRRHPPSPELAESLESLAWLHFLRSDYDKAEPMLREVVALRRRLSPGSPQLAASLVHLGTVLTERYQSTDEERSREIERILREALGIYRGAADELGIASTLFQLAKVKKDRGDLPGAETLYRQVLPINRRIYGGDHPEVAQCRRALALTLIVQAKQPEEAKALLRQALASQRKVLPKTHPDIAATLNDLALAYTRTADYASAEPLYREALASELENHGEDHADTATVLFNLASAVQNQGRLEEAAGLHERSLATRRALYGEKHIYVAQVEALLSRVRSGQGRHAEALDLARRALETGRELLEPGHTELIGPLRAMGTALLNAGRPAEAEPHLRETLDILRKTKAPGYFQTARVEVLLGSCLARLGRVSEARTLITQGLKTLESQFPPGHPWVKDARQKLDLVNLSGR